MLIHPSLTRLALLAAASLLVACGGGGGNSSAGASAAPTQVLVTGFKGMLSGAVVSVYEMRGGPRGKLLARGPTDANGEFAFRLRNKPGSPVMIELSAQAGSTMLDEVSGRMSMPAGLRLRAAVPDISQLAEVHVTPFSDMAAAAVEASGKITPTAIEAANRAVSAQYFEGESILATRPLKVDEIESAKQRPRLALTKALTALVAAVAQNVATGEAGQTCQQADYGERLLCALNGLTKAVEMANDGSVQVLPQFAAPVLTKGFELINSGQVKPKDSKGQPRSFGNERYGEDKIAQFARQTEKTTYPAVSEAAMDDIAAAKALLAKVRGTVRQLEALSAGEFLDPAVSRLMAQADFSAVREAGSLVGALYRGARQADQGEGAGECGAGASCQTRSSAWRCTVAGCQWRDLHLKVLRENQGFSWHAQTQEVSCSFAAACQTGPLSEPSVGVMTVERDAQDRIIGVVAQGKVPGGADDLAASRMDLDVAVRLEGEMIGQGAGTLRLSGTVRSDNAGAGRFSAHFDERSSLAFNAAGKLAGLRLGVSPYETAHHRFEGLIQISDFAANEAFSADELLPQALAFEGAVTDTQYPAVGKFFEGRVRVASALSEVNPHQPLSRANFPRSALQLGGALKVASHKSIGLYVDAKHLGPDENTLAIDYSFTAAGETAQFKVEAISDDNGINAQAVIRDASGIGVRFARTGGVTVSEGEVLRVPDKRIGRINTRSGVVHFNDGSYESLY